MRFTFIPWSASGVLVVKDENSLMVNDQTAPLWYDVMIQAQITKNTKQRITNDGDDKTEDYNDENDNYCPGGLIAYDKRRCR